MGLLDMTPEQAQKLVDFGMGMMAASARPGPLGAAIASGYGAMNDASKARLQEEMLKQQMDLQKQHAALYQQQVAQAQRQADREAAFMSGALPLMMGQQVEAPRPYQGQVSGNFRLENDAQRNALVSDLEKLQKTNPAEAEKVKEALIQQGLIKPQVTQSAPDIEGLARYSAAGQLSGIKGASGMMELAKFLRPDWQQIDSGGQISFVNKNSGQMPTIGKTMTPDAIASNQVAWFNALKPSYHDGALVSPTGEITRTPMYAPPKGSPEAQQMASTKLLPLLDQADKLLNDATGSLVGSAVDTAAGWVGKSTKGAQSSAQLKALEGQIMMAQPRMEGPQSDKDVALYRQMAGLLGDSTVPVDTRRAALQGIKELHQKYASVSPANNVPASSSSAVRKYNPATGRIE